MTRNAFSNSPAVIVGAGINGLGVARSLARAGVPIWLIDSRRSDPGMWTRHGRKLLFQSLGGHELVDSLLQLRSQFAVKPVLFLTQEKAVYSISEQLEAITAAYRLSMPGPALMNELMDKVAFQHMAERHGFPIPRAVRLRDARDLHAADALSFPCILKPITKTPAYEARFKKGYKLSDIDGLRAVLTEIDGAAEMIAQEWIEGGDDQIYFCLQFRGRDQKTVASFAGRKLRSWPPRVGGTASCIPAPEEAAQLKELTEAFFAAVGFFGMGSMEFKRDIRTGRFMMVEPTVGRTDFQEEVATLNGVNIPYAAYCYEAGIPWICSSAIETPTAWAVSPIDRWACELQPESAHGFPSDCRRTDALWRIDDPLPWCYEMTQQLKSHLPSLRQG